MKVIKIVLDLDILVEDDVDPDEIADSFERWLEPDSIHKTYDGSTDYQISAIAVVNEGDVEKELQA